ncbi:hypothetical protein PCANC_13826 [Puccinia coronata f. sp. avenae]|uniref:Uncharacterized protein n=1 Tax=Puccinia coronata f. sp. avenae TaxID=200324 RepID=A0A2N5UD55_9BASI|nr:hypothetical protein PCANC_13826 [Puccinia coronata f. sp. avenae]
MNDTHLVNSVNRLKHLKTRITSIDSMSVISKWYNTRYLQATSTQPPDLAPHIVHRKFNQVNNPIVTSEPVKECDFKMKSLASVLIGLFEANDFDGHQLQAPVCHHGQTREFQGLEYPVDGC